MLAITVDTGTTNTRIRILENDKILAKVKSELGIKDVAITGDKRILERGLAKMIADGLTKAGRSLNEVEFVAGAGMITSNLGLVEIPHQAGPLSIDDLAQKIEIRTFEWMNHKPFYFIPGIKNQVTAQTVDCLDQIDVMRGEEVEAFGIMELCHIQGPALMVLPGSHTKFVYINRNNQIEKCSTTMLGEFLHALVQSTILSDSIPVELISSVDPDYVVRGFNFEKTHGLTKAVFSARLMDITLDTTPNQRVNFLTGALVGSDIGPKLAMDIEDGGYHQIYIGGSSPLKEIFHIGLTNKGLKNAFINLLEDEITEMASSKGTLEMVARYKKFNP